MDRQNGRKNIKKVVVLWFYKNVQPATQLFLYVTLDYYNACTKYVPLRDMRQIQERATTFGNNKIVL